MKVIVRLLVLNLMLCTRFAEAQITTPIVKANFGVDGELRANFFNGIVQSGNDDWFNNGTFGLGQFVIDTTGAAGIVSRYSTDMNFRKLPFFRTMRVAPYSLMNNRRVIDAVFIRDYHGDDSTMFANGASKNGMSPASWSCPVAQSIPDKNEILDMMVHVRRAGPGATDSLWMFGGISIENTTGNRYFDFEMYQTDIYYDRPSLRFYGYGPDDGHTAWRFNANGDVTTPGDIIFTAEYSSNSLTYIEARIWVDNASLSITPQGFNWTGTFDGAGTGSQYGYAGITPNSAGVFYTGLTSPANAWAGPFQLVLGDNSVASTYTAGQFMEFSVNLTKLGLDPVTLLGGDACGMPFRRILVKTRASTSFTAALKDFVGPFDFFLAPRAIADADVDVLCGSVTESQIQVTNAVSTSVYNWSTTDGSIVGPHTGSSITINSPGTYIVTQVLQSGCSTYAMDTVVVAYDPLCSTLGSRLLDFRAVNSNQQVKLNWTVAQGNEVRSYEVERSTDGIHFSAVERIPAQENQLKATYTATDDISNLKNQQVFYRIKVRTTDGKIQYSHSIRVQLDKKGQPAVTIVPNPVKDNMQVYINSDRTRDVRLLIYDITGQVMRTINTRVQKGISTLSIGGFKDWRKGIYAVKVMLDRETFVEKIILTK